jgi:hypothetical protein
VHRRRPIERIRHLPGIGRNLVEPAFDGPDASASNLDRGIENLMVLASRVDVGRSLSGRADHGGVVPVDPLASSSPASR